MNKFNSRVVTSFLVLVMALILLGMMGGSAGAADDVWLAEFWNNKDLSGNPVYVRQDKTIDFDWGHGSPAGPVNSDNFSARWTRNVYFPAGNYRFNATMDDAMSMDVAQSGEDRPSHNDCLLETQRTGVHLLCQRDPINVLQHDIEMLIVSFEMHDGRKPTTAHTTEQSRLVLQPHQRSPRKCDDR